MNRFWRSSSSRTSWESATPDTASHRGAVSRSRIAVSSRKASDSFGQAGQDLISQVVGHMPVVAGELVDEGAVIGLVPERQPDQLHPDGPPFGPLGEAVEIGLRQPDPHVVVEERGDVAVVESEIVEADLPQRVLSRGGGPASTEDRDVSRSRRAASRAPRRAAGPCRRGCSSSRPCGSRPARGRSASPGAPAPRPREPGPPHGRPSPGTRRPARAPRPATARTRRDRCPRRQVNTSGHPRRGAPATRSMPSTCRLPRAPTPAPATRRSRHPRACRCVCGPRDDDRGAGREVHPGAIPTARRPTPTPLRQSARGCPGTRAARRAGFTLWGEARSHQRSA